MMTLDRKYHDELLKALRMHEISGERVGEVLAEVDAHVTETGEDPVEAFGKPRDYARQVAAQLDPATGKRSPGAVISGAIVVAILALFGTDFFGDGLAMREEGVHYTMRDVVSQPIMLVLIVTATLLVFRAYTASAHNKVFAGGAVAAVLALVGSQMACDRYLDDVTPVLTAPSRLVLALGIVFLVGMFAMLAHSIRRGRVRYPTKS